MVKEMIVAVSNRASVLAVKAAVRMGVKPVEMKRFVKFVVVGGIGFIVDFGLFNLLRLIFLAIVPPTWNTAAVTTASSIAFLAAIISNFMWNRYWTYPDARGKSFRRQFAQFVVVNFAGIIIRGPIVYFTHTWFGDLVIAATDMSEATGYAVGDNLSSIVAVGIVMFWNFFANRYWTYNDVE